MSLLNNILERLGWSIPDEPATDSLASGPRREQTRYRLRDRAGRVFIMTVDTEEPFGDRWWVVPEDGKRGRGQIFHTGYVDAVRDANEGPDTLTLGDIQIADVHDRHNGLGTAMLRTLFEVARGEGIRYIHGFVTAEDQQTTPGLIEWYKREGFSVRAGRTSTLIQIDLNTLNDRGTEE